MVRALSILTVALLVGSIQAAPESEEHPLTPLIKFAQKRLKTLDDEIHDYTCTLVKQERIGDRLREPEYILLKLRHEQVRNSKRVPFSVYLRYQAPDEVKNREVVYFQGRNRGKIVVWRGGPRLAYVTTAVAPKSEIAMRWGRYPITELGMKTLIKRLVEMGKQEMTLNDCKVEYIEGAKVNGRSCLMVQLTHPVRRPHFRYYMARVFIDDKLKLPIRYASYDWPTAEDEEPPLIEEYSYINLKLNPGLSDHDFDYLNPAYRFRKTFVP